VKALGEWSTVLHTLFRLATGALVLLAGGTTVGAAELVIKPGEVNEFSAPLPPELRNLAGGGKPSATTEVLGAVAVPVDFSPDRAWPILLISTTSHPAHNSSRKLLRQFAAPAVKAGWVVVAADPGVSIGSAEDNDRLRYYLLIGALTRLHAEWPGIARWPRAFGGFSGGAKRSAMLAGYSTFLGHPVIGVYQAGCNTSIMREALEPLQGMPRTQFLATPVFLSSGRNDTIATPRHMDDVQSDLKRAGFTQVKLARFQGGHEVHHEHIEEALRWFAALAGKP
jgi:pimeloyl-ACP methyl ester carboxylesterase